MTNNSTTNINVKPSPLSVSSSSQPTTIGNTKNGEYETSTNSSDSSSPSSSQNIVQEYPFEGETQEDSNENTNETYSNLDLNTVKLFVGQIPYSYSEDNLFPLFSQFGPVAEIVVIRDRFTYKSRGCAFVSFKNKQDADVCIRELNQRLKLPPLNTPLRVKYAYTEQQLDQVDNIGNNIPNLTNTTSSSPVNQSSEVSQDLTLASNFLSCLNIEKYEIGSPHPENKLFIRNIPKNVTEDELTTLFETFGEILDVVVLRTTIHTSKGCGFIKFVNSDSADMVINAFRREIMEPIQEYQQEISNNNSNTSTSTTNTTTSEQVNGQKNTNPSTTLVSLTNKLVESSFLMKGAVTPLLVRYADKDTPVVVEQYDPQSSSYPYTSYGFGNNQYQNRRRKSVPFAHSNNYRSHYHHRGGAYNNGYYANGNAGQYYQHGTPSYYDNSITSSSTGGGYSAHHAYHPPHHGNYYYPPNNGQVGGAGNGNESGDTVYFYHLYNNPSGATTTTTITAPEDKATGGGNSENISQPSPVPPMYYYYPPYYYHPQYAQSNTGASTSTTTTTTTPPSKYATFPPRKQKQKYSNNNGNHQEHVTKCSDA